MATVEITRRALADLERLFDFIAAENPQKAREQILSVRKAFELLADHPLLGRSAEQGRRELILSRGRYGYIAKYRWLPAEDIVLILAVRHQLEAGYAGESTAALIGSSPLPSHHAKHLPPVLASIKHANNGHSALVRKIEDQEVLEILHRPFPNTDEIRIPHQER